MKFPRFYLAVFVFAILAFAVAACNDDSDPDPIDPTPIDPTPIGIANQIAGTWEGIGYAYGQYYNVDTHTTSPYSDTTNNTTISITALDDSTVTITGYGAFPWAYEVLLFPGDSIAKYHNHFSNYTWELEVNVNSKKITTKSRFSSPNSPAYNEDRGEFFY